MSAVTAGRSQEMSARDARMRGFKLYVFGCCAARTRRGHERSIEHSREMAASVSTSPSLRVSAPA